MSQRKNRPELKNVLDGMRVTVTVETAERTYQKICTPIPRNRLILDHYLAKFSNEIWRDITWYEGKEREIV